MPLSYVVPLGLFIALVGGLLYYASKRKKLARLIMIAGLLLSILAFLLILIATNSGM